MDRRIIETGDGSHTVAIPDMNVTYHSKHGAIQESMHVFIEAGLRYVIKKSPIQPVKILEIGFGTGLNAFLTAIEAINTKTQVYYMAIEQFPISMEEVQALNYTNSLQNKELFVAMHEGAWNKEEIVNEKFILRKEKADLIQFETNQSFNLIYFDAFAPSAQPELWTEEVFRKLFSMLLPNGFLVTYCSKSAVRRDMESVGFKVEKIPGPPGKREMVRAHLNPSGGRTSQ